MFFIFSGFATCTFYFIIFFPNLYALAQELTKKKEYVKINIKESEYLIINGAIRFDTFVR